MKWPLRAAIVLLVLAFLAGAGAGALFWVVESEPGTRWLITRLLRGTPGVTIARVRGSLLDGIVLEDVRLRTARDELDIDSLALAWNRAALFAGTLAFERADASRAAYRRLPGVTTPGSGPPELPWPLRLEQASIATLSVTIAGRTVQLDDTRFAATYGSRRLELEDLATTWDGATITADAAFALNADIDVEIAGEWAAPIANAAASGRVTLAGTWPDLRIEHALTAPFAAITTGSVELGSPLTVDVVNDWQGLAWPGVQGISSSSGRIAVRGSFAEYRYDGSGVVEAAGRSAGFTVEGAGAALELALDRLALTPAPPYEAGTLTARGNVSLGNRTANVALTADALDPAWFVAAWPGALTGTANLSAGLEPELNAALDTLDLSGELRGYRVRLRGAAALGSGDRVRLDGLRLDSGANHVVLTGTADRDALDLAVAAELAQIDLLVPNVGGAVTADVAVGGTWAAPRAAGRVEARGVAVAGIELERVEIRGEAGLAPDALLALTVDGTGIARGPVRIADLRLAADGTTAAHTARIEGGVEDLRATVDANGGVTDGTWRGTVSRIDVAEPRLGPWRLDVPAELAFGRRFVTLANSCLLHTSQARWCTELNVRGRPEDSLVVSGQNFNLAAFKPLLPPALELEGVYQLSGALLDLMGEPRGAIALTGNLTQARIQFGDTQSYTTELDRVQAGMTLTDGRLELTAAIRSTSGSRAETTASIADVRERDSAIRGFLHAESPDLNFLTLLSPALGEVSGALAVDLNIAGTVAEPTVDGNAAVANGRIGVPQWGLVVDRIEATASSREGRSLDIAATGYAGDGALTLDGTMALDPEAGWPTRLRLRGDTVQIIQRADAEIFASPDLTIDVTLPVVAVAGRVDVPRATLTLEQLPAQAVAPSPDAVVHTEENVRTERPLQVRTNIELAIGDEVRYSGLNLDTTVMGQLRLATEPGRSPNATGTLLLAGSYDAYGQTLDIDRGQLLFSGPLDDPVLDVRAVRKLETVEVGVELTGMLKAPRTRVFSTPAMSEADALSYLLFGRPASSDARLGAEETSALQTAALSLGLQQALPVVQRIGNTLGLDELTVRSTSTDPGALMAGKYLSPRVYIRYSYGLFNRIGGLLLRFKVNERLSLETRSGDQKSMDLLYTVEKD